MIIGERAASHQRRDDVDVGQLRQFAQRLRGACLQDATADVEDRPLGGKDQLGGLLDHARMTLRVGPEPRKAVDDLGIGRPVPLHRVLQHVLRHVDQRRARTTCGGNAERLAHGHRQVLRRHHQLVVLGDAARDADGVAFLEGIGADRGRRHLTGDAHHGDRVHVCVAQRRDHVGGGRSTGHHGDAGTTGDVGVALRHVAGALFVAYEDVPDGAVEQGIVGRQDAATRQAEHHFDTLHLEGLDQGLGPCELHVVVSLFFPSLAGHELRPQKPNGPPNGRPRCTRMWACIYMSTTTIETISARIDRSVPCPCADAQPARATIPR